MSETHRIEIGGNSCKNVVINDDTSVDADTDGNTSAGTWPVAVQMNDLSVITGPDFTFTPA